jgi:hypothetical protein
MRPLEQPWRGLGTLLPVGQQRGDQQEECIRPIRPNADGPPWRGHYLGADACWVS